MRLSRKRKIPDTRSITEMAARLSSHGFVRVHKSHVVNPRRVYAIRRRGVRDWEIRLEPPAGTVVPVGRSHLAALWSAYGE